MGRLILLHYYNCFMPSPLDCVWNYTGEPVPERYNQSGFTVARDNEWQWHQLGHMHICTSPQTASHHSVFYRPVAIPATEPTASKH